MSGPSFWEEYNNSVTWFDGRMAFIGLKNDRGETATVMITVYPDRIHAEGWDAAIASGRFYLDGVLVEEQNRRKGFAGGALRWLAGLADKHDITLSLYAKPFGIGKKANKQTLVRMYKKHGFRVKGSTDRDGVSMFRPQISNRPPDPEEVLEKQIKSSIVRRRMREQTPRGD